MLNKKVGNDWENAHFLMNSSILHETYNLTNQTSTTAPFRIPIHFDSKKNIRQI